MQKMSKPIQKLFPSILALSILSLPLVNDSIADDDTQAAILNDLEDQSFMMRYNQMDRTLEEMRMKRESDNRALLDNFHAHEKNKRHDREMQERFDLLKQGIDPSILDR
jgi:hypothetical protein